MLGNLAMVATCAIAATTKITLEPLFRQCYTAIRTIDDENSRRVLSDILLASSHRNNTSKLSSG